MKNPIGICSWSLRNELAEVSTVLEETGLSHIHLGIDALEEFREPIVINNWTVSCTMIGFPQEDYSTLDSIRKTGGIVPDDSWEANRDSVLAAIEQTAKLGVGLLSFHAGFIDHNEVESYRKFCARMHELAEAAQAVRGIQSPRYALLPRGSSMYISRMPSSPPCRASGAPKCHGATERWGTINLSRPWKKSDIPERLRSSAKRAIHEKMTLSWR